MLCVCVCIVDTFYNAIHFSPPWPGSTPSNYRHAITMTIVHIYRLYQNTSSSGQWEEAGNYDENIIIYFLYYKVNGGKNIK